MDKHPSKPFMPSPPPCEASTLTPIFQTRTPRPTGRCHVPKLRLESGSQAPRKYSLAGLFV